MSSLVDMWNEEFAKLRAKGKDVPSPSPSRVVPECSSSTPGAGALGEDPSSVVVGYPVPVSEALRIKRRPVVPLLFSEAAVSMLVDCFSP